MYQIRINAIEGGGYEMNVGCQRFFYGTHAAMMTELSNFMEHPEIVERQYNRFTTGQTRSAEANVNPLRTTLGGGSWGGLTQAGPSGFEYREPIDGIRFTNGPHSFIEPNTNTLGQIRGAGNTGGSAVLP